jgi:ATP-dependent RNA helicase DeaD
LPRKHLGEDEPERVDVGATVDRLREDLLGRHVRRRAERDALRGEARARSRRQRRDAEIEELHEVGFTRVGREEDVRGLDVTVHDALRVRGIERLEHLPGDPRGPRVGHRSVGRDRTIERGALEQLEREEGRAILACAEVEQLHDMRVPQGLYEPRLALEPSERVAPREDLGVENLDRDDAIEAELPGSVHGAEPAGTEEPFDAVAARDRRSFRERFGRDHAAVKANRIRAAARISSPGPRAAGKPASVKEAGIEQVLGPALCAALEQKGYTTLTPVQQAVLAPELAGRDLRISSQTGSGKTVAIGFVLRDALTAASPEATPDRRAGHPKAIVVVPTRELAKQVETELAWLYAPLGAGVTSVSGGANYRFEHRALSEQPAIVVGTPGRLLDHLQRGSIDASGAQAVVLDEADRMLDMGFQEDLESIFAFAPPERRTHLVSATFPREVLHLANRVQRDPVRVEATPLGEANTDIEHVVHLVEAGQRLDALVNLLLAAPDDRTIVFAKTRADVAQLADELQSAGFEVGALSGEMEQRERNRALGAFKHGRVGVLVATDVAARGIDVQDVSRVIHLEPPNDADAYTHRSGRTGRAGKKGRSLVLATLGDLFRVNRVTKLARVPVVFEPVPGPDAIRAAEAERVVAELTTESAESAIDPRTAAVAARLAQAGDVERTIARLLARAGVSTGPQPRDVRVVPPPPPRSRPGRGRDAGREPHAREFAPPRRGAPSRDFEPSGPGGEGPRDDAGRPPRTLPPAGWVPFRVTWGESHGADPRRLLAMVCRRGGIASSEIGAIRIGRFASQVEVSSSAAELFETSATRPDPRDPRVRIERDRGRGRDGDGDGDEGVESAGKVRPPPAPRIPARGGFERGGFGRGGFEQGAPPRGRGGFEQGAPPRGRGGFEPRGFDRGGSDQTSPPRGRGGFEPRGFDRGGSDQANPPRTQGDFESRGPRRPGAEQPAERPAAPARGGYPRRAPAHNGPDTRPAPRKKPFKKG